MLRQRDSAGALRGLFSPNLRSRNLSAASVLRADGKAVVREREGLLSWLKGVFNKITDKSIEERGGQQVAAAIVDRALQRDQPEIAVPEVAADTWRKVDVVNQKLANFGTVGSTTKFGGRKFRSVGQRDAGEYESTNTNQQLAIYAEPSSGVDFKERKNGVSPERGRDSLRFSSQFVLPGEIHRAERIGRGMIEFVARDDANVAAYYRCYTSPRRCYRLLPPRTRQLPLLLLATYGPNRYISVPTRAIAACVAKNSKAPIREPNMPEKYERTDERKKRDERREPVIRTESKSIDSSESRAAMEAEDNLTSDPDEPFRYKWGVKFAEEEPAEASDNDNFAEKRRRYVTKRHWGVNMTHPDVEGAAPPTSESAHEYQNAPRVSESEDAAEEVGRARGQVLLKSKTALRNEQIESKWRGQEESFSAWTDRGWSSASEDLVKSEQEMSDASLPTNTQTLKKILKAMPGMSRETITSEDNAPEEEASDAEISAWQSLAMKAKPAMLAILSASRSPKVEKMSIRPEAPQQKLDVRVVKSVEDIAQESRNEQSAGFKLSSMGLKRIGSTETPNLDNFSPSKKLHTASAPIHGVLRDVNDITWQGFRSLPVSPNCAGGNARVKDSGITLAFSTDCGGSEEEKMSGNVSTKQDEQETDLRSLNEERSSDDSPKGTERILFSAEPQTALCDHQKQLDVGADVTGTANTVANEETEMSTRRSQDADCENADRASVSTAKDEESRGEGKSICGETKRESHEDPYTDYNYDVDHVADTDGDPTRSHEAAGSIFAGAKNTVPDSRAKDARNFGEQYVTDGDYARVPGDPYPYSKENLVKWRMMPIKRQTLLPRLPRGRSTPRNANDAYANAAGQSYGSHAVGMETSGSGDGAMGAKNVGLASGFRASSRNQRVVAPDCDAGDALEPRTSTEASSRLDDAATTSGKTSEAERGDDASLRAYHQ